VLDKQKQQHTLNKFRKIDREYLLTDSSVNCYGFRLDTNGYMLEEFQKNPIGYHMHAREKGVLVKWSDFRKEGDKVYAKPIINMSHERAEQTIAEIENGFLNAASVGHLVFLEYTDDPSLKLDGQTSYTVTKWYNRECSLVDIPGNFNALALYDQFERPIQLADFTGTKIQLNMKKFEFNPAQLAAMKLDANAAELDVQRAFDDLVAKAAKADGLQAQLTALTTQVHKDKVTSLLSGALVAKKISQALSDKLAADYATNPEGLKNLLDALAPAGQEEVGKLLETALTDRKITKEVHDKLAIDYAGKPGELKTLLDAMPKHISINSQLNATSAGKEKRVAELAAKGYDELMETGLSVELSALSPEAWKEKQKEAGIIK
jgi:hypothetical protein